MGFNLVFRGLRRTWGKKYVYHPADLEAALPEIRGGIAKKAAPRVKYLKVHIKVSLGYQIFIIFYRTFASTW
jgi:hypothetical protein